MTMMNSMLTMIMIILMLISIFMSMTENTMKTMKEKLNLFECGFNLQSMKKIPFSINFFLITIMFLMFDVEISILIPMIFMNSQLSMLNMIMFTFFTYLLFALMMEWKQGMLEWSK